MKTAATIDARPDSQGNYTINNVSPFSFSIRAHFQYERTTGIDHLHCGKQPLITAGEDIFVSFWFHDAGMINLEDSKL